MATHWDMAKHAAWREFGQRYWRWFVFGPIAVRIFSVLVVAAGLLVGALYVARHVGGWLSVAGHMLSAYVLPAALVAVGVALYGIVCFTIWRMHGWRWKFSGFSTKMYTLSTTGFLILVLVIAGGLST